MKKAVHLARKGSVHVYPNPRVAALVVQDGCIIAEGYHEYFGAAHAEQVAIQKVEAAGLSLRKATLYCTLEPCSGIWEGKKRPPCSELIVQSGIRRVVLGSLDPNPNVRGTGLAYLRDNGVEVVFVDELEEDLVELNEVFISLQHTSRPFVHLKVAQSLDARMALDSGASRWITGEQSRAMVHRLRSDTQALMTGIGTVLADDPLFTVRHVKGPTPRLVIIDSQLQIPMTARLLQERREVGRKKQTLLFCSNKHAGKTKVEELEKLNVSVFAVDVKESGGLDLAQVMQILLGQKVYSLFVECGPRLLSALLEAKLVDKISCFIAPKLLGGQMASFRVSGVESMEDAIQLHRVKTDSIVNSDGTRDTVISGYIPNYFIFPSCYNYK